MKEFGAGEKVLTIVVIALGVGTALYTFSALVELLLEGRLSEEVRRRRMEREIAGMRGHVIVCGWGRVGKAVADQLRGTNTEVVVIDMDEERVEATDLPVVLGDAREDACLERAGIAHARALVAALTDDADNLYVTLTARGLNADLFIVARARILSSEPKLLQAGANRVVNPQKIGGARMAAFTSQPHVAEFLDVVMHDGSLDLRLEEMAVPTGSPVCGQSLRDAHLRDRTGALVLAIRGTDGEFATNPDPAVVLAPETVLIAIGTSDQLDALGAVLRP